MDQESYSIRDFQQRLLKAYKEAGVSLDPTRESILEKTVLSFEIDLREHRIRRKQREMPPDQLMNLGLLSALGDISTYSSSDQLQHIINDYADVYHPTTPYNERLTDSIALELYQNAVELLDASNNRNPFRDISNLVMELQSRIGGESHTLNRHDFLLLHAYLYASGLIIEEEAPLPKIER